MKEEFLQAVKAHQEEFGVSIGDAQLGALGAFYDFLMSRNEILHLVAPCRPEEFAVRHVLESLFIAKRIPKGATLADVGSGGGFPGIPLAVFRGDIRVLLIESKARKAEFLNEAVKECGIDDRAKIINRQFEEARIPADCIITARALDKFPLRLPRLAKWAGKRKMILFGGPGLAEALASSKLKFGKRLIPASEQRFVFDLGSNFG